MSAKDRDNLRVAMVATDLPCKKSCEFRLQCVKRFKDGTCEDKMTQFASGSLNGTPDQVTVKKDQIIFETTDTKSTVKITKGCVSITHPKNI